MSSDRAMHRSFRRLFDLAFASVALTLAAPVIAVAAVAIRLETRGPAFFRQTRLGREGVPFDLHKLRGMYVDAERRWPETYAYAEQDPERPFHLARDPRVTRVGHVIRRLSIDELPNFWNVVRGDMSVVGPRPEIPELAHLYGDRLETFLSVKPGITSPAKASGRDSLSFEQTLQAELDYIANQSFRLDLETIVRTAVNVVRGHDVV